MKNTMKNTMHEIIKGAATGFGIIGLTALLMAADNATAQEGHVFSDDFAEQMDKWNQEWFEKNGTRKCHNRDYKAFIMPKINEYFGIETEDETED